MSKGSLGQLNKKKIKTILASHYKAHVSLKDIVSEIRPPLARSKVIAHLNEMRNNGEVAKEKGKRGKYYLTHLDASTAAYLLGFFSTSVFDKRVHDRIDQHIFSFLLKMKSADAIQKDDLMALKLFKLSNKIGALVIFYILQGLDPKNKYISKTLSEYSDAKLDKDLVIQEWVKDCMHWEVLLLKAIDYIRPAQDIAQINRDIARLGANRQVFYLDKDTLKLATESYSKVYPDINRETQHIVKFLLPK